MLFPTHPESISPTQRQITISDGKKNSLMPWAFSKGCWGQGRARVKEGRMQGKEKGSQEWLEQ